MSDHDAESARAERWLFRTFLVTAVIKLLMTLTVPFTSDEAYFALWGRNLDYGYYDHGAMTGWWLWVMLQISDVGWWLRLPALLTSHFVGWALWRMLRPIDPTRAAWVVVLYLVSPISLLNILITTDTPLQFFSIVSMMFALRGVQHGRHRDYLIAGLALGLAFLSKYFAVLLGLSYAVLLLGCLGRPRIRELLILLAGIIPGVGINVAWNYHHWWANVLFNLVTRQETSGFSPVALLLYVVTLAALVGPGVIYFSLRRRDAGSLSWGDTWRSMRANDTAVLAIAFAVPLAAFALVALSHTIGVHWVLSFVPCGLVVLFTRFRADGLRRLIRPTLYWSAFPVAAALMAPLALTHLASRHSSAFSLVLAAESEAVLAELAPLRSQYLLTTPSYAKSATFGYLERSNVPVIGPGSFHARQDDLHTDFRDLDGRDLMIVAARQQDVERSRPWFASIEERELTVQGARFRVILGRGFNYAIYRELVLQEIANRYYQMPDWLRPFAAPCFFFERYDLEPELVPVN